MQNVDPALLRPQDLAKCYPFSELRHPEISAPQFDQTGCNSTGPKAIRIVLEHRTKVGTPKHVAGVLPVACDGREVNLDHRMVRDFHCQPCTAFWIIGRYRMKGEFSTASIPRQPFDRNSDCRVRSSHAMSRPG